MAKSPPKDVPLLLRRRKDGSLHLDTRPGGKPAWPPRHEFSTDWLLHTPEASLHGETIVLQLENATATYRVVSAEEHGENIGEPDYKSTGVWGYLVEGTVN